MADQTHLDRIRRAVEMTALCKRVEYDWQSPPGQKWVAELWCNDIGQTITAVGDDAWTAVQAVYALRHQAEQGRYRPRR